ncbi:hypothetical protein ACG873_00945 (plasmid) [Mesorhizobium sp. AaZ16]|uniref:hypothetical protein n=1 Tax=Mesorhizobium sp. AaZ16 TaxID=3402289 RepID=UPI00374F0E8A
MSYQYFSHEIDSETHYCVKCGRFLMNLQENKQWIGNEIFPACIDGTNVTAISHMVRGQESAPQNHANMPPRSFQR